MSPFAAEFFGGRDRLEADADSLFGLVRALDAIAPGFADAADARAAFAIDGVIASDWSSSLSGAGEVILLSRVAGG